MQIKLVNWIIEDLLQDFKANPPLLNKIIFTTATVIIPEAITCKQNSFKRRKYKLMIQKEIERYRGEIFMK